MLFEQHDAQWIEKGCPGEGNILIFNNGVDRPDGRYSSIIEISPPIMINGNYRLIPGESYGPKELIWQYTATNPNDFSAKSMSGAQRLPNGNTIVCDGSEGYIFEISPSYEIIWDYQISFSSLPLNDIFKIHKYSPDYPGLSALFTKPDKPIIDGPTSGKINNEYTFSATINNSENDSVYYLFDWGDGSKSNWLGPYKSNIICTANHSWKRRGDFSVRVKVKDINGLESDWSIHPIKMAKFKLIDFLIMNIGNNNPYLFSFYQTIYGHNFFKNK